MNNHGLTINCLIRITLKYFLHNIRGTTNGKPEHMKTVQQSRSGRVIREFIARSFHETASLVLSQVVVVAVS